MKTQIKRKSVIALVCIILISMTGCKKSNDSTPVTTVEGEWVFVVSGSTFGTTVTTPIGSDGKFSFSIILSGLGSCTYSGIISSTGQLTDGKILNSNMVIGTISGSFDKTVWVGTGTFSIPGTMDGNWTAQKK